MGLRTTSYVLSLLAALTLSSDSAVVARQSDVTDRLVRQLKERLVLTDEQATRVEALVRQRVEKRKAVRQADDPAENRREMREQLHETDVQIEALLTAPQKAEYAAMKAERRERMMKLGEERPRSATPAPSPSPSPQ